MIDKRRRALSTAILSIPMMLLFHGVFNNLKITRNTIVQKGGWLLLDTDS